MASSDIIRAYLGCSTDIFTLFGLACAAYFGCNVLCTLTNGAKTFFFARALGLTTKLQRLGQWAVVTGATDGIGKAYAEQLAEQGLNIVLISRTLSKLEALAGEIESKYKVKTKVIAADFSKGTSIYPTIKSELADLEVGVLVNNVGMSYECPGRLLDFDNREKLFMDLIHLNITSMTMMTSLVLPQMVERKKGAVINISSFSGVLPTPMLTVYSACKVYADFFSSCLRSEYASKGIIVQSVRPGFVATKMSRLKPSYFAPSPTTYVKSALGSVGVQDTTTGFWVHALMSWVLTHLPISLYYKVVTSVMAGNRVKFLKKREREAKAKAQ